MCLAAHCHREKLKGKIHYRIFPKKCNLTSVLLLLKLQIITETLLDQYCNFSIFYFYIGTKILCYPSISTLTIACNLTCYLYVFILFSQAVNS